MGIIKNLKTLRKSLFTSTMLLIFSFSFSQNSTNNLTPYSLDFVNGISSPLGDFKSFSESGFNSSFIINKNFCNHISIGLSTNYTSLAIKNTFDTSNEKWNSFSISIGPQYSVDTKKVFVQFYGRLGLSFISTPEITDFYPQTNITASSFKKSNINGLNTRLGINLGTQICSGLRFFVSSEYSTNLNSNINYQTRDLSSAVGASGQIDPDLASEIAFKNNDFSFSSLNFNFGIRLDLNTNGNRSVSATDYNSSRSNKSENNGVIQNDNNGGNGGNGSGNRATDYNSSRSNKSENNGVIQNDNNGGNGGNGSGNRATDYNSSRSNKSENNGIIDNDNNGGNGGNGSGNRATDYNSSRSNKSENNGVIENENNGGNGSENSEIISRIEEKTILNGKLLGILLVSRKFEFKKYNGDQIIGIINSKISDEQLTEYSARYLNKPCKISMLVLRTGLIKGKEEISYELLEILE